MGAGSVTASSPGLHDLAFSRTSPSKVVAAGISGQARSQDAQKGLQRPTQSSIICCIVSAWQHVVHPQCDPCIWEMTSNGNTSVEWTQDGRLSGLAHKACLKHMTVICCCLSLQAAVPEFSA